jgi:hypothetical protein
MDTNAPLTNTGNSLFISQDAVRQTDVNWHIFLTPPDKEWKLQGRWRPDAQQRLELIPSE